MTKKKEPKIDLQKELATRLEVEIRKSRIDAMGVFQNKIVALIDEAQLPAQEIYFVLHLIADNVKGNFVQLLSMAEQARASKSTKDSKSAKEK